MAEISDEVEKEQPSTSDLKSLENKLSTAAEALQSKTTTVLKTKDDYKALGRSCIEEIKASLLASSASFNRKQYADTLEDPYMKAYQYLEEKHVLALLEDLITLTAFQQPSEPFSYMMQVVRDFYADIDSDKNKSMKIV